MTTTFQGFHNQDFEVLDLPGLDARMEGIRSVIQPKFQQLGELLSGELSAMAGDEMFVHIAKHARRTVNPPADTWMAFCGNKRGYKQHPHFQIGLWNDRVFAWFALIYELPDKRRMAEALLEQADTVRSLVPEHYSLSFDHMKKEDIKAGTLSSEDWTKALERFRDVKSCELLIGRVWPADSAELANGEQLAAQIRATFQTLMPLYQITRSI